VANLVRVSEAATLALHTMALLARDGEGRRTNQALAECLDASEHHLAKVMQQLVKAGLVHSQRGPLGGFILRRPAEKVRLLQVYEAIEGPISPGGCLLRQSACPGNNCRLGTLMGLLHEQIRDCLARTTLAEFSKEVGSFGTQTEESVT
jgi:Rrf2 family protein